MAKTLYMPDLKYTTETDTPCAMCRVTIKAGELCYRHSAENPDEWRHVSHGPVATGAATGDPRP